jgi:hypothetical protein
MRRHSVLISRIMPASHRGSPIDAFRVAYTVRASITIVHLADAKPMAEANEQAVRLAQSSTPTRAAPLQRLRMPFATMVGLATFRDKLASSRLTARERSQIAAAVATRGAGNFHDTWAAGGSPLRLSAPRARKLTPYQSSPAFPSIGLRLDWSYLWRCWSRWADLGRSLR